MLPVGHLLRQLSMLVNADIGTALYIPTSQLLLLELAKVAIKNNWLSELPIIAISASFCVVSSRLVDLTYKAV